MSQNPQNPGWQGGPQGPGQQWNQGGQPPQGPPPGYRPQGGQQNFGPQPGSGPQQNFGPQGQQPSGPPSQGFGQQGQRPGQQNFGPQGPQNNGPQGPQNYGQQGPQNYGQQGPQNYGQQGPQNYGQAPAKPKSKAPAIIAGVVALALVVGGVIFGLTFFKGATPAAAKGLPANVLFAAELNLAPSNADKTALKNIVEKFPSLNNGEDAGDDYKKALWNIIPDSDDKPDYDSEVKPWLGDSVAVGIVDTGETSLQDADDNAVLAIETTDPAKAEEFAKKHMEGSKSFILDGLLIVVSETSSITADSIKGNTLADSDQYKQDMAKLGDGSLASLWFGPKLMDLAMNEAAGLGEEIPAEQLDVLKGMHGAVGLKVAENMLTLKANVQAPNAPDADAENVQDFAKGLSGDALGVIALGTSAELFTQYWDLAEEAQATESLAQVGITSPDDLKALLGKRVGVSVSMKDQQPIIGIKLETDDPEKQKQILDKLKETMTPENTGMQVEISQEGNVGVVAVGQSVDDVLNPSSKVGDLDGFKKVVDGSAQQVMYLNVEALKAMPEFQELMAQEKGFSEAFTPITSIGATGSNGSEKWIEAQIRVTFK